MTPTHDTKSVDSYILDRAEKDAQRLRIQAACYEPATEIVLNKIGLKPGRSCLDAGCAPDDVMKLLAERVGQEEGH
jgi:cyclopropane fatty-acyl-phospholipid synthase-like methyltransferase